VDIGEGLMVDLPSIDDLIITKRWSSGPKDMIDIQWLESRGGRDEGRHRQLALG
jgi:hypothetical protein